MFGRRDVELLKTGEGSGGGQAGGTEDTKFLNVPKFLSHVSKRECMLDSASVSRAREVGGGGGGALLYLTALINILRVKSPALNSSTFFHFIKG